MPNELPSLVRPGTTTWLSILNEFERDRVLLDNLDAEERYYESLNPLREA